MASDIGWAVNELRANQKVRRAGWNGKGMYLALVPAGSWSIINTIDAVAVDIGYAGALPWVGMKTADNKFVPWLCSQTDLLATDWELAT